MLRSSLLLTDTQEQKLLLEDLEDTFDNDEEYLKEHEDDEEIRELIKKLLMKQMKILKIWIKTVKKPYNKNF